MESTSGPFAEADLVKTILSLSRMTADWPRREPRDIAGSLADFLAASMNLEAVFVSHKAENRTLVSVSRAKKPGEADVEKFFSPWIPIETSGHPVSAPNPFGPGKLQVVVFPIGFDGEFGTIAAASDNPSFPSQAETILLQMAAHESAAFLQQAVLWEARNARDRLHTQLIDSVRKAESASNEKLRLERETQFQALADAVPGILFTSRHDGYIEYMSTWFYDYTGFRKGEGEGFGWMKAVHPDDLYRTQSLIQEAAGRGEPFECEYRLKGKNGSYLWFGARSVPAKNENGRVTRWVGTSFDIHRQKETEYELREIREDLEAKVNERTKRLKLANEALEKEIRERLRAQREVIQISDREQKRIGQDLHDSLSQQLVGVGFMVKLLEEKIKKDGMDGLEEFADIQALIRDAILDTKRLVRGLNPIVLDNGFHYAVEELAANIAKSFTVECECFLDQSIKIEFHTAAVNLYRIVQEAMHNAVRHGKASRIAVILERQADKIRLAVSNNGAPLSEERKNGMGMRNMKYRAEMLGAPLNIFIDAAGRTVVECLFSIEASGSGELQAALKPRGRRKIDDLDGQQCRVIVIDDHAILRKGIIEVIRQEKDFDVCAEAGGVAEAMEAVEKTRPDIALVDISLGDGNGIELVEALQQKNEKLLCMIVSMHEENIYAEKALAAGAMGYVTKQDAAENVVAAMRIVLNGDYYVSGRNGREIIKRFKASSAAGEGRLAGVFTK